MKRILMIILFAGMAFLYAQNYEYKIIESITEEEITLFELAEKALSYDVVFFGELHENELLHHLEFELLKEMQAKYSDLIVSMEMFERDVQPVVDEYLAGKMSEEEFMLASRAWSNYLPDYKPIVDFAKKHQLTLVAANIPRRYAAMINKKGINALDSLPAEEKKYVAKKHKVFDDEYKRRFVSMMEENLAHIPDNPMGMKMDVELLYAAQCIKDDTMAESILKYQRFLPRKKVLHFNGDFHSRKHLGTAQKLQIMEPMLHIAVITPIVSNSELTYSKEDLQEGDFLIVMTEE
ncbi:MAG: ChaN family lipoprotein [Candidatus Cloacimonetes bacterium]|nr:ChaN family lipoprotein [Candidatus Cloacimonadota bacterium]MCF7813011.1 ChaN family lipoprotein [Candidatus Cloacimonadota bacterium]MCF7867257.1 ChaN family lipoprotein [Candidatus Cloacimonadota bacterium]MCF7882701.1 ChaN family lipoprotein [Candidatus Cloacimonadota bacterium]